MKKIVLFSTLSLLCSACQQQTGTNNDNTADSTKTDTANVVATQSQPVEEVPDCSEFDKVGDDLLANHEPEKAKENAKYMQFAQKIWQHRLCKYDLENDLKWVRCTQNTLTEAFNATQPKANNLSDEQKADSMAGVLFTFLTNKPEDYSTFGMVLSEDEYAAFTRYHLTSAYDKILKKNPKMAAEINAWDDLRSSLDAYMINAACLENFGGSIVRVNVASYLSGMLDMRLNDAKALLNGKKAKETKTVDAAKNELTNAIEKRFKHCSSYQGEDEEEAKNIDQLRKEMTNGKDNILAKLETWLKTREGQQVETNTVAILSRLTKMNSFEE